MKDAYPLPQVNDIVDSLNGQKYFSTLDLTSGYWQVPVENESIPKTAFVIPGGGHFEFWKLPFGMSNAVPTFFTFDGHGVARVIGYKMSCLLG